MFPHEFSFALLLAVAGGIVLIAALWLFYDRRDRRFYARTRRKTTFHCLRCGHVYTSVELHDISPCPRCAHPNPRLHF